MKWERLSKYAISCHPWYICKVTLVGVVTYELWRAPMVRVGAFSTADKAKGACDERILPSDAAGG
jgi:hypothetical protein